MSYNGSGTFNINTAGQPVVTGTVITSTAFNLLTADLASGLTTALTKDGQTTPTANIPMGTFKITGLGAGTAATDAAQFGQLQAGATQIATVTGTDTFVGTLSPALSAYATGNLFSFVAPNTNTGASTINLNSLGAKSITKQGTTALVAGDIVSGRIYLIEYDGTRFQLINPSVTGVTSFSAGSTGLTPSSATTGAVTLAGTLATTNGGTGLTSFTANGVVYASSSSALATGSALTFDGTNLGIGTSTAGNAGAVNVSIGAPGTTAGGLQLWTNTTSSSYLQWGTAASGTSYYRGYLQYNYNAGSDYLAFGIASTEAMRLTGGNLGLGVTPSADWASSGYKAFVVKTSFLAGSTAPGAMVLGNNAYNDGAGWKYVATGTASYYLQYLGAHSWYNAPSGTAGNAITFTQAMTLDSSGRLAIGGTSATARLDVQSGYIRTANGSSVAYFGDGVSLVGGASASSSAIRFDGDTLLFAYTAAELMRLTSAGNLTVPAIYTNTTAAVTYVAVSSAGLLQRGGVSALKYKQDVRDLEEINVDQIRAVRYKSKCENDDQTKDHFGVIADEVDAAGIKELVTYGADGEVEGFQYERLTVVLLKEIQSLRKRLAAAGI